MWGGGLWKKIESADPADIADFAEKSTFCGFCGFCKVHRPQSIVHSGNRVGIELVFSSRQRQWAVAAWSFGGG